MNPPIRYQLVLTAKRGEAQFLFNESPILLGALRALLGHFCLSLLGVEG